MKFLKILSTNVLAIAVVVVLIFTIISFILNSYTRHGESLTVPDIRGLKLADAQKLLEAKNLRFTITDSLYFEDKPKLSVLEQNPAPQSKVKEGRVIYITINTNDAPLVQLPNLVDVSLRQAQAMLQSVGLKPGKLIYKPDIAQNVVLDQLFAGKSVRAGHKIPKGSVIDLVLGNGLEGEDVALPDLDGLTYEEASNLLQSSSLNVGSVLYQGAISDSSAAKVFKQRPAFSDGAMAKPGQPVDLFLKQ